jgi:hypothetical protein
VIRVTENSLASANATPGYFCAQCSSLGKKISSILFTEQVGDLESERETMV